MRKAGAKAPAVFSLKFSLTANIFSNRKQPCKSEKVNDINDFWPWQPCKNEQKHKLHICVIKGVILKKYCNY